MKSKPGRDMIVPSRDALVRGPGGPGLSRCAIAAWVVPTRPLWTARPGEKSKGVASSLRRKGLAEWHRSAAGRPGQEIGFSRIGRVDSPGCSRLNRHCQGKETPAQRAHKEPEARCRRSDNRSYALPTGHNPNIFYRSMNLGFQDPGTSTELTGVSGMMRP